MLLVVFERVLIRHLQLRDNSACLVDFILLPLKHAESLRGPRNFHDVDGHNCRSTLVKVGCDEGECAFFEDRRVLVLHFDAHADGPALDKPN